MPPKNYIGQQVLFAIEGTPAKSIGIIKGAQNNDEKEWLYYIDAGLQSAYTVKESNILKLLVPVANKDMVQMDWSDSNAIGNTHIKF